MFKRRLKWTITHSALVALLYLGMNSDYPGWPRVAVFVTIGLSLVAWLIGTLILAMVFAVPDAFKKEVRDTIKVRTFPWSFTILFDVGLCLWLVYHGWVFTGIVYLSTIFPEWLVFGIVPEKFKRDEEKAAKVQESGGVKAFSL